MIGVPAAHGPMNGTFILLTNGTMASDTGVCSPPNSTATFSRCTSSRAAIRPLPGLTSSSRRSSSTGRPSRPPDSLISSIAMVRPRVMASPDFAEGPERLPMNPILIGSAAWPALAPPSAAAAARPVARKVRRAMPAPVRIVPIGALPVCVAWIAARDERLGGKR